MADTDIIGIVSLLLAAGGAAYLFRARLIGQRALPPSDAEKPASKPSGRPPEQARDPAKASEKPAAKAEKSGAKKGKGEKGAAQAAEKSATREAKTMPPTLRPASDPPAAKKAAPTPAKATLVSAKSTTPESPAAKAVADTSATTGAGTLEKLVDEPTVARPDAPDEPPTVPPPKGLPPAKDRILVDKDPASKARESAKVPLKKPPVKKQTIVGLPAPAQLDVVPKLDFEEDEDVEPTRVGRHARPSIRPPVEKHVFDEGADGERPPAEGPPLALAVYALAQTDPGKRRKQNEDSYLVRDPDSLYVVADGMGGHRGGQHASRLAVETINKAFETRTFDAEAHAELPPPASELARAIQMANAMILTEAELTPELKGMGTTLCAARFCDGNQRLFIGHVGDSRCYRLRDGVMKQMTADHTMADYGVAGPEGSHLSRALGVWPTVPIDVIMATPQLGDVYLLCSDGLTKMLTNETIATQLLHEEDPKAAVDRLVFFANAHGGKDNITVILLRVVEPGWVPPSERGGAEPAPPSGAEPPPST